MTIENGLSRSTPEAQGIASEAVLAFVEGIEANGCELHSFMLLRHGQVVAEGWWQPYGPEYLHMMFSLSKSFTSTAAGLAVAEGCFSVDDPVLSFFPEDAPAEVSETLAAMQVRHLLSMSTGHAQDTTSQLFAHEDGNWVKAFLAQPVDYEPGTHFVYNSGATYMVSAIVQKTTGLKLLDYLQPRLFEPLGIKEAIWTSCPRGINSGGFGLSIKTEDIARFGQMYLQKGVWQGQRLVPEAWVEAATAYQVPNNHPENIDWQQGYGYQFWRCRHGAYRGDGAFGQFCVVMPDQQVVVAMTAGAKNMQAVLDLVWEHLLPAIGPAPLPENPQAQAALDQKLASLTLLPVQGQALSPTAARVSGKRYHLGPNEQMIEGISFDFGERENLIRIWNDMGEHQVICGSGEWLKGTTTLQGPEPQRVTASGAWTANDTYSMQFCFYETPFRNIINCHFDEERLTVDSEVNVAFGPTGRPQLVGQAE